ncbi:pre-mRNA-splicing factor cwc22-like [Miscanthus floridulus]|uniref:pre-mRNA-splicing factor cwc22-like n=1 Tax=Miscanthus floridulus TaxID=154761 RepID=UPI003458E33E
MARTGRADMMPTRSDASRNRKRPRTGEVEVGHTTAAPPSKRCDGGGIYVPPYRATTDDADDESGYERRSWDVLRRSITGLAACPASFTPVFAALAAVANARLAHAAGDTHWLAAAATFVAHLVNQGVPRDLLALLLDRPTDGSVEVAIGLVTHCGAALQESCPRGLHAVLDCLCLRSILHDGDVDKRVEFLIEDLFAIRKAQLRGHPPVQPELDLIEPDDQQDEAAYEDLKRTILGDFKIQSSSPDDEETDSDDDESAGEESETDQPPVVVRDQTDTDLC